MRGASIAFDADVEVDETSIEESSSSVQGQKRKISESDDLDDGIDWTDSIFQRFESDNDPIVLESHKLLFFTIPKNSCTEWKQLFRRMMGYDNWNKFPFLHPHHPDTNGLKYLGSYDKDKQKEYMTSPEWTRAIFIRDPLERTLSAYLNKGLSEERYIKKMCCHIQPRETDEERQQELQYLEAHNKSCVPLTPFEQQPTADTFTFETFVNEFMWQCNDKHWRPQSQRMHDKNWKFINFVGRFDDLEGDARRLLERIGAYEEFGSNGWGPDGSLAMFQRARSDSTNTHSRDKISQFYSPALLEKVMDYLRGDYENPYMNFSLPDLDGKDDSASI
mmetsp:Transcript_7260/g.11479  ORF Transcript_7260/g.11479 Transcript_7260/m.11479 type:complete len:333 (-) Transcript_7260:163-1161(-)